MDGLYRALRRNCTQADYRLLPSHDMRQKVNEAYTQRYRRASDVTEYKQERAMGVKRVDFLGGKNTFMGLSSTGEGAGVWQLNVS